MGRTGPKHIAWDTVSAEDWARGCHHVAELKGVTPEAARAARKKLSIPPSPPAARRRRSVPEGLKPTHSPSAVVRKYGVSISTALKWLASVGRPPARRGRPRLG